MNDRYFHTANSAEITRSPNDDDDDDDKLFAVLNKLLRTD